MSRVKYVFLAVLLVAGMGIVVGLVSGLTKTPLSSSFVPLLDLVGKPIRSLNAGLTKLMPLDALDEKLLGEEFAKSYESTDAEDQGELRRLERVMVDLRPFAKKPFAYKAYLSKAQYPNAFALPGGVIVVTQALLDILPTDGELAAVLGHEMGHVELSHCLDAVRFELLARKYKAASVLEILDFATALLLRHSFSKTQEAEADEYSFTFLKNSPYDPSGLSGAFQALKNDLDKEYRSNGTEQQADLVRDYLLSHPPLELRIDRWEQEATRWHEENPKADRIE